MSYTASFYRLFRTHFRRQAFAATSKLWGIITWSNQFSERSLLALSCHTFLASSASQLKETSWDLATEWITKINRYSTVWEISLKSIWSVCLERRSQRKDDYLKIMAKFSLRPPCSLLGYKKQADFTPIFPEQSDRQTNTLISGCCPAMLPHPSASTGSTGTCRCYSGRTDSHRDTFIRTCAQFTSACSHQIPAKKGLLVAYCDTVLYREKLASLGE